VYDPDKYVNALQSIQDQLSTQLNDIKQQFNQLDESIENAAYDPNQQLRLLQEGIADERDSLY
jgi:division protein CdvB (Snf7/Vps24/ESCRT-III family)